MNPQITRAIAEHLKKELHDYTTAIHIYHNHITLTDNRTHHIYEIEVKEAVRVTHYKSIHLTVDYSVDLRDPNMLDGLTNRLLADFKASRCQTSKPPSAPTWRNTTKTTTTS